MNFIKNFKKRTRIRIVLSHSPKNAIKAVLPAITFGNYNHDSLKDLELKGFVVGLL